MHITLGDETVRVARACIMGLMGRNRPGCSAPLHQQAVNQAKGDGARWGRVWCTIVCLLYRFLHYRVVLLRSKP